METTHHLASWVRAIFMLLVCAGVIVWLLWRALKKSYDPPALLFRMVLTAGIVIGGFFAINGVAGDGSAGGKIGGVLLGAVLGLVLAFVWVPVIVNRVSDAFGSLWTGGSEPPPPQPYYSIAETRVKQGKYREAVYEIQQELEKFPTDVTGHMKLAEIQARYLNDLPGAQLTIERLCNQPGHLPPHLAHALNSLADWHLKVQDPDSARQALERIIALLPETEQSNLAAQRIAHLASKSTLLSAYEHRPIPLRHGIEDLGLRTQPSSITPAGPTDEETAQQLVRHLQEHPLDNSAREQLARLYLDHYQRLDLAIGQLEELITAPNQSGRDVARWLNLEADWQLERGGDYDAVLGTLQRIVDRFQGMAAAELALQRIEHLRLELKGKQKAGVVQLGTYEKDLGLKTSPRRPGNQPPGC
jgi:tetratricopeptide (TPR) repeat protein